MSAADPKKAPKAKKADAKKAAKAVEEPTEEKVVDYHDLVITGLMGPLHQYYIDDSISEIMINGPDEIFIERSGQLIKTDTKFNSEMELRSLSRAILQYVNKRLTKEELSQEARMPDGSRVHILQSPAARPGLSMAIRKFPKERLTLRILVDKFNSMPKEAEEFLTKAMQLRMNIIVSGGTGSGKTTMLNVLSEIIEPEERVIVIEDATELQFPDTHHVLQFETVKPDREGIGGVDIRELLRASLRMRPDRVIVGECRAGEAIDMVQAMNTGHAGSMSTVHSNSPIDCLARLETLCLMSEVDIPLVALQRQLASAINVIVQVSRHRGIRRVTEISEVMEYNIQTGEYVLQPLFTLQPNEDGPGGLLLTWTGAEPDFDGNLTVDRKELVRNWA